MVISNIIGGLGNQMFQYAVGRTLSLNLGASLKLDIDDFDGYDLHQGFELNRIFTANFELALETDKEFLLGWQRDRFIRRIFRKPVLALLRNKNYIVEPSFTYWNGIKSLKNNVYLDGYWQSEKYFIKFADVVRSDFSFKLPFSASNLEIAKQIGSVNAVSLHVRRGDYVSNKKTYSVHGVCSLDYYRVAIEHILKRIEKPVFFVFSDDIEWVRNNLNIDAESVFVDHNSDNESYNDMRLMSLCQHHIIANSSFSWWGAWLNPKENKIVIAPKKWFVNQSNGADLIPSNWVTL